MPKEQRNADQHHGSIGKQASESEDQQKESQRSAHVSQIIHEIMNQLSVIGLCNHQLRDLLAGDLDEAQRKQFEIVARAVNTTAELAAKLKTNSKI